MTSAEDATTAVQQSPPVPLAAVPHWSRTLGAPIEFDGTGSPVKTMLFVV